jgi:MFS family permease
LQNPVDVVVENDESQPHPIDSTSPAERKSIWHNRDFLILWSSQVTSVLGGQMAGLAYPLLILALTHSPSKAGLVPLFWTAPFVLFGLPAGALVDRWNRKTVMLVCDTIRMLGVLSLPLAYFLGFLSVPLVYAAALAEGVGFCFFNLAEISALTQVVTKTQLPHAMAMNEGGYAATSTVGPGAAGGLISLMRSQIAGTILVFIVDGVSYMASLVGLASMRTPFQQSRSDKPQSSILAEVKEGLEFIWAKKRIRTVATWSAWNALIYGGFQLSVIILIEHHFHRGAGTIGPIFSAGGIGGVIGAVIAPRIHKKFRFGYLLMAIVALQGVFTFVLANAASLIVLAVTNMFLQMGNPVWNVTQMTYRLSVIPDQLQGRVNACYRLLIFVAFPVGSAIGGILLEHFNPRLLIGGMAAGAFAGVAIIALTELRST